VTVNPLPHCKLQVMTSLNSATETPRKSWLERGFLLAVVLGCAAAMSPNQADPDLWGHVTYGLDALRDGLAPTATYSYTAEGYRWINHENLAEVALALTAAQAGHVGLLLLKFSFSLLILGSMAWWGVRQNRGLMPLCIVLVIVAINLAYWWAVRPQIFSFTFMAVIVWLLSWAFAGWEGHWHLPWFKRLARDKADPSHVHWFCVARLRWLWLAPMIFFIWTNTHGGFVAGVAIFSAILGLRAIEAICVRGWSAYGLVLRLGLMISASCAVTLINPYSWRLHEWLWCSLSVPRPEIGEWTSLHFGSECFWPFVALASIILLSLTFSRRPLDFTQIVLLALVSWQAITHERHTAFLALLAGYWLPPHVESMLARWKITSENGATSFETSPRMQLALAGGLVIAFAILFARLYQRLSDMPVAREKWPVAALEYIAEKNLQGNLLVTFNWAQYAIAAVGPSTPDANDGLRVQFDGRYDTCYPFLVVDRHFDFILGDGGPGSRHRKPTSGPIDGTLAITSPRPDVLLLSRGQPNALRIVAEHSAEWVLLYQDAIAQVWGRRDKYGATTSPYYLSPAERIVGETPQVGSATWPALPHRTTPGVLANACQSHNCELLTQKNSSED
jgi:hypothetical protein